MKGNESIWDYSTRFLTPRARGVKITKIAIALERDARLFRPLGQLFWDVFTSGLHSFHATAFRFSILGDMDALGGVP